MAHRLQVEGMNDLGVFTKLTNTYCLCGITQSNVYYNNLERLLASFIPVIRTSVANCRILGRLAIANRHGLIIPDTTTDEEMSHLRNSLPDEVKIKRASDRLSGLGNMVACNDYFAICHHELDDQTIHDIEDTLNVEAFRNFMKEDELFGTYCLLNNKGGMVPAKTAKSKMDELEGLLNIRIVPGTVNKGSDMLAAGMIVNDWTAMTGLATTQHEMDLINTAFQLPYSVQHWDSITRKNIIEMSS